MLIIVNTKTNEVKQLSGGGEITEGQILEALQTLQKK